MRGDEFAVFECFASLVADALVMAAVAEVGDEFVVGVEEGHARFKVGDEKDAVAFGEMAGGAEFVIDESAMTAFEVEDLEAAVAAIRDDELGRGAAGVHDEAVGAIELARFGAGAAESAEVFAVGVEAMDEAGAVAVGDEDDAIAAGGDVGGDEFGADAVVDIAENGGVDAPEFFAVGASLHDEAAVSVAEVEEFLVAFERLMEAMGAAFEFAAPAFNERAFVIEHHDGVLAAAVFADGLFDDDAAEGVFHDAVGVSEHAAVRNGGPVVDDFVLMFAAADDGPAGTGFVFGENRGSEE